MRSVVLLLSLALTACAGRGGAVEPVEPEVRAGASSAERGRALAAANCAGCHAVTESDAGAAKGAIAFRELHRKYPVEHLQEALGEGIAVGHPQMPEFKMSPQQVQDLIAYLKLLDTPAAKPVR